MSFIEARYLRRPPPPDKSDVPSIPGNIAGVAPGEDPSTAEALPGAEPVETSELSPDASSADDFAEGDPDGDSLQPNPIGKDEGLSAGAAPLFGGASLSPAARGATLQPGDLSRL